MCFGGDGDQTPAPTNTQMPDWYNTDPSAFHPGPYYHGPLPTAEEQATAENNATRTNFTGQSYNPSTAIDPTLAMFSGTGTPGFTGSFDAGAGDNVPLSNNTPGGLDFSLPNTDTGNLDYLTQQASPSGPAAPSGPAYSFGGVQSFGGDGQSSIGSANITDLSPAGSNLSAFGAPAPSSFADTFTPNAGIEAPSETFPDPTSTAATTYDPFNNTDPNKDQDRIPQNQPFPLNNDVLPQNATPTAGTAPNDLTPPGGFTPQNVGNVPLTSAAAQGPQENVAPQPQWSADGQRFIGDPSTDPNALQPQEAYPGQNRGTTSSGSPSSSGQSGSLLDQLASAAGRNALPAALAAGAGLYSVISGNHAGGASQAGLTSTIPQIQGVINQVQQQAQQLSAQGQGIINSAQPISAQSQRLMSYVATGTLPPEYQTQVDEATRSAIASAISNAAARGQNVNPGPRGDYSGNSVLQQQIQSIRRQAVTLSATLARQLYDAGIAGIGAANQTIGAGSGLVTNSNQMQQIGLQGIGLQQNAYNQLIQLDLQRSQRVGQAISNFATALGGGGRGTTIQIGGTARAA